MNGRGVFAGIVLGSLFLATQAFGFCRQSTCEISPIPVACKGTFDASGCSNEGLWLRWAQPCLSFSVQRDGSRTAKIGADAFERLVKSAFGSWSGVACNDGGRPNLHVDAYPWVACDSVGFNDDGPNQNLWVFRDEPWQYETGTGSAMALTTLSVNPATGVIYDADVELNSHDFDFTTGDDVVAADLNSIVLHESGHVLGIGHSEWATSTMAEGYVNGATEPRTLEADDKNAICAIMPPGELPANCDPEPRQGFSPECQADSGGCSCSVATKGRSRDGTIAHWSWVLLLAGARRIHGAATRRSSYRVPTDARLHW